MSSRFLHEFVHLFDGCRITSSTCRIDIKFSAELADNCRCSDVAWSLVSTLSSMLSAYCLLSCAQLHFPSFLSSFVERGHA